MDILFDLFYFDKFFVHERLTQKKKEVMIDGRRFYCKETEVVCEGPALEKSKMLILRHEELHTVMVNHPKQNIYISCAKESAMVIDSDALVAISFQKEKGYQIHIYPSQSPVYYNQQLIKEGEFDFDVGDQVVVDQRIIEMREKQMKITSLGKSIQLNPWSLMEEPYLSEYPKGFPFFRRSPRVYLEVPKAQVIIQVPDFKIAERSKSFMKMIAPSLGMSFFSGVISFFSAEYSIMSLSMWIASIGTMILSTINYLREKKEKKSKNEESKNLIQKYMFQQTSKLSQLQKKQKEVLEYMYPSMDQLALMTKEYHSRIYERKLGDKDFLTIRLGDGEVPTSFQIDVHSETKGYLNEKDISSSIYQYKRLTKASVAMSLKGQTLGLVGSPNVLRMVLQSILFQISVLHSYQDVEFITLFEEKDYENKWKEWRWLPHNKIRHFQFSQSLRNSHRIRGIVYNAQSQELVLDAFHKVLTKRRQQLRKSRDKKIEFKPIYIFSIVEEYWLRDHEINEFLVEEMSLYGVIVIWAKEEVSQLPETVTTLIKYKSEKLAVLVNQNNQYVNQEFAPNQLPVIYPIEKAITKLANLFHEEVDKNTLPESISLLEQYKVQSVEELDIVKRWTTAEPNKSLCSLIGWQSKTREIYWDLHERVHGPHALIGGTTGSGKSEFLTTYLIGLAINFSPEDISILIIDWKGGGIAQTLERLPHFMGAITNLDRLGITRALTSIKAELEKRQKWFTKTGVNNINDYMDVYKKRIICNKSSMSSLKPLPHLFIVVDEFAELKVNVPEFLDELTSVARIGRSLGVHLILATQKPAGVINDQIESNSTSKIALKMASDQDSNELLKTSDAAYITQPGRGYLKVGENDVYELFQSGYTGTEYNPNETSEPVVDEQIFVIDKLGQLEMLEESKEKKQGGKEKKLPTHREIVINKIKEIFEHSTFIPPDKPWLPELPNRLVTPTCVVNGQRNLTIPIGLLDIPSEQQQCIYYFDLAKSSHTAIIASQGFGKTTLLQTIVLNIVRQNTPDQAIFYLLDFGNNGLLLLKRLPHIADIASLEEEEKSQKIIVRIEEILRTRKKLFKENGTVNFWRHDEITQFKLPVIFILIDSYDGLSIEDKRKEKIDEMLLYLLREGANLGIYLILSANSIGSIRMNVMSQIATKICMYLNDNTEINMMRGIREPTGLKAIQGRGQVALEQTTIIQFYLPVKGANDGEMLKNLKKEIIEIDINWTGSRPEKIPMVPTMLTSQIFYQFMKHIEKNNLYLGLNQRSAVVESFEIFQGNGFGLFFSSTNQCHKVLPWLLKQLFEQSEVLLVIDVSGGLKKIESKVSIYIDVNHLSECWDEFHTFWQTLLLNTKSKKIILINGIAEFVEKMSLNSDEISKLLNGSTANVQLIFIDHLMKLSTTYNGMIHIVKETIHQFIFGDSLQAELFLEDFVFNWKKSLANSNWLYSLKGGNLETIVIPIETNDSFTF